MRKMFLLCVWVIVSANVYAQLPDWTDNNQRKLMYNEQDYIVGFASEANTAKEQPTDLLNRLEGYAKSQINEQIMVNVQSLTSLKTMEVNNALTQSYLSLISSSSNLILTGLKKEVFYDNHSKTGYVLIYANRNDLINLYKNKLSSSLSEIERKVGSISPNQHSANIELEDVVEVMKLIPEIEQYQSILVALTRTSSSEILQYERLLGVKTAIDAIVKQAQQGKNSIQDACQFIAFMFKNQVANGSYPVLLTNFTFQDTRMTSEFSKQLSQLLTLSLVGMGGFKVLSENSKEPHYILGGTYWKQNDELKLISLLRDNAGKIIASAEAYVPLSILEKNGVAYLPENFQKAYERMRVFKSNEIVKGDLNIEVWTNKGDEGLVFTEGEKLKFYIRANKECYIRFIYHMADNQSVLLFDNYYVAANMVNKVIELPDEFECAEPFGNEVLQVNAQTTPFEPLRVKKVEGYDFIDDSLESVLVGTRGLKRVMPNVEKAEKRIVFTTLKK